MSKRNVVIIGASFGGLELAKLLLPQVEEGKINLTLIEKSQSWTPRNAWKHLITMGNVLGSLSQSFENLRWKESINFLPDQVVCIPHQK